MTLQLRRSKVSLVHPGFQGLHGAKTCVDCDVHVRASYGHPAISYYSFESEQIGTLFAYYGHHWDHVKCGEVSDFRSL